MKENLIPKVELLKKIWGYSSSTSSKQPSRTLSAMIYESPGIMTLHLERNIKPTLNFLNQTGYVQLDQDWRLIEGASPIRGRYLSASLFKRLLPRWHICLRKNDNYNDNYNSMDGGNDNDNAASLDKAALHTLGLPQWSIGFNDNDNSMDDGDDKKVSHQKKRTKKASTKKPSLFTLAFTTDEKFCQLQGISIDEYKEFCEKEGPKLKFLSQFETWIKTGQP
eukprot:CAMPEP_0202443908 /NCGR_PEP_ID=MMETSP1360-20130828/3078_1 /ASSEMBLY_ACC=CAM_ASM_000848 /TAXON_ID=515479 /ORGANISM="Licmophora paradoxa, Strain CCMP2313" /LENGTH=221 /DNA_ID=CAMNT_0049059741 /DNA_START=272 /DNA_END=933 /DNA_ORIENTATION=-